MEYLQKLKSFFGDSKKLFFIAFGLGVCHIFTAVRNISEISPPNLSRNFFIASCIVCGFIFLLSIFQLFKKQWEKALLSFIYAVLYPFLYFLFWSLLLYWGECEDFFTFGICFLSFVFFSWLLSLFLILFNIYKFIQMKEKNPRIIKLIFIVLIIAINMIIFYKIVLPHW